MKNVHLQGIGEHGAIMAKELNPGMTRVYNYGYTGEVVSVTPHKGGKSVIVETLERGKVYKKTMRNETLVAIA